MRNTTLLSIVFAVALAPSAFAISPNGFVVANADGSFVRGTKYSVTQLDTGRYLVNASDDVRFCAYSVTAGSGDTNIPAPAVATAVGEREDRTGIIVATYDHRGNPVDSGFHLIVRCASGGSNGAAVVDPDGTLARGILATSAARTDLGAYTVTFANGSFSTTCAYTADIGLSAQSGVSAPGIVNVAVVGAGTIAVRTYDTKGNAADLGFHVFGACNL